LALIEQVRKDGDILGKRTSIAELQASVKEAFVDTLQKTRWETSVENPEAEIHDQSPPVYLGI